MPLINVQISFQFNFFWIYAEHKRIVDSLKR